MKRNILMLSEDGFIRFEGFEKIKDNQPITINVFGQKRVVISLNIPNQILDCHNVITISDHKCYNPDLVNKLIDSGIKQKSYFVFITDAYYLNQ